MHTIIKPSTNKQDELVCVRYFGVDESTAKGEEGGAREAPYIFMWYHDVCTTSHRGWRQMML